MPPRWQRRDASTKLPGRVGSRFPERVDLRNDTQIEPVALDGGTAEESLFAVVRPQIEAVDLPDCAAIRETQDQQLPAKFPTYANDESRATLIAEPIVSVCHTRRFRSGTDSAVTFGPLGRTKLLETTTRLPALARARTNSPLKSPCGSVVLTCRYVLAGTVSRSAPVARSSPYTRFVAGRQDYTVIREADVVNVGTDQGVGLGQIGRPHDPPGGGVERRRPPAQASRRRR